MLQLSSFLFNSARSRVRIEEHRREMSDLQEKIISLKMQQSDTIPKLCSTKEKEMDKSDFIKIENATTVLFETLKYAKINYPLGKFVGIFLLGESRSGSSVSKALWQKFLPIWRSVRKEAPLGQGEGQKKEWSVLGLDAGT